MQQPDFNTNRTAPADDTPADATTKAHLTAEEAAAYMGLPIEMFRTLATDPELQPVRIKDAYHYRLADVQRYMAKMEARDSEL